MERFRARPLRARLLGTALAACALALASCTKVPVTGRSQLSLIPSSQLVGLANQEYDQFLKEHPASKDPEGTRKVRTVGQRIAKAVEGYMGRKQMADRLEGYEWEFNLVDGKEINAFCMPGGKVVVYTGLLPVTRDETGLAVVMGHEIAHAIADHGGERMSQQLLAQLGGTALSVALSQKPAETRQLAMAAFGAGASVGVLLPFSRLQESEADHLGLIFMALAGYDPSAAVEFWSRMKNAKTGGAPPQWLSTHPADDTRIAQIKEDLPEALRYYRKTPATTAGAALPPPR